MATSNVSQTGVWASKVGLSQWVSNLSRHQNHLEGLLKQIAGLLSQKLWSSRWRLRICISNRFPDWCRGSTHSGHGLDKSRITLRYREVTDPPLHGCLEEKDQNQGNFSKETDRHVAVEWQPSESPGLEATKTWTSSQRGDLWWSMWVLASGSFG